MLSTADIEFLGFTPMDDATVTKMKQLWSICKLPREPDFGTWSQEYGREVWRAASWFSEDRDLLVDFLEKMDVWNPDMEEQQWVPKGWTPAATTGLK